MLRMIRDWSRRRILERAGTSPAAWREAWSGLPELRRLREPESGRLLELATLFLHEKSLEAVRGFVLTPRMRQTIALKACLPILNLGFDWFDRLATVVVYPETFISEVEP